MSFKEVRVKAVELSGRTDLVVDTTDHVDNGMNWYINRGQMFLDSLINTENSPGIMQGAIVAGNNTFKFARCRSILKVWFTDSNGDKIFPRRMLFDDFIEEHPKNVTDVDRGTPKDYAIDVIRDIDTPVTADDLKKGIIFSPPADASYTAYIEGLFFATALSGDSDENYWTQLYEDILVFATLYKLELSYRNTEGSKDWLNAINSALFGIDADLVDQVSSGDNQMIG